MKEIFELKKAREKLKIAKDQYYEKNTHILAALGSETSSQSCRLDLTSAKLFKEALIDYRQLRGSLHGII